MKLDKFIFNTKDELRSSPTATPMDIVFWKNVVAEFEKPSTGRAVWQIINMLVPYALLWYVMFFALAIS